jgi:DNA-directed RNA polymerase specialized sigma24 family protein
MTGPYHDYIFCSSLLPVQSLDAELKDRQSPLHRYRDPAESPLDALLKKRDRLRLSAWVEGLPAPLAAVARGLMRGETQASLALRLGISEPAVTKRLKRLIRLGQRQLADLRRSPILN